MKIRNSFKIFGGTLFICVVLAGLFGACSTSPSPEVKPIKIGACLSLTGVLPDWGQAGKIGDEFRFEQAGWEVAGRPIEYVYEDDGSLDSVKALDAVKKLVEVDKVDVVLAPVVSGSFWAVQPYTDEKGVLLISQWGRHDLIPWETGEPRLDLCSGGSCIQQSYSMGAYAYETMGIRTVSCLGQQENSGYMCIGAFADAFTKAGGTVVNMQWLPWGTIDFAPYFVNLGEADAVVQWFSGAEMQMGMIKQFYDFGLDETMELIISPADSVRSQDLPGLGDRVIGMTCSTFYEWTVPTAANEKFVADFEAAYGMKPTVMHALPYAAMSEYLAAVEATGGDTTPTIVRDAMIGHEISVPWGTRTVTSGGYSKIDAFICEVQKVNGVLIWQVVQTYHNVDYPGYYTKETAESFITQ
jgi:branched-chain amino acid transport system substrate-binding protein